MSHASNPAAHDIAFEEQRGGMTAVVCACGVESIGPSLTTAKDRHGIHEVIATTRELLARKRGWT